MVRMYCIKRGGRSANLVSDFSGKETHARMMGRKGTAAWPKRFSIIWRGDPPASRRGSSSRISGSPSPSTRSPQALWARRRPGNWYDNTRGSGSKWDQRSKNGILPGPRSRMRRSFGISSIRMTGSGSPSSPGAPSSSEGLRRRFTARSSFQERPDRSSPRRSSPGLPFEIRPGQEETGQGHAVLDAIALDPSVHLANRHGDHLDELSIF